MILTVKEFTNKLQQLPEEFQNAVINITSVDRECTADKKDIWFGIIRAEINIKGRKRQCSVILR